MNLTQRAKKVFTPALDWETDLAIKSTQGCHLEDYQGKKYLDFTSGVAVCTIGYNHPKVVAAAKAQLDLMLHHGTVFLTESVVRAGEKLQEIAPKGIAKFFFSNSGAEAVEGAMKLARFSTKRQGIIAFRGAFHGRTYGAMTLTTSKAKYRTAYMPLVPGVYHARYPNPYRDGAAATELALTELRDLLKREIAPEGVAAIFVEPVQGEGGYIVPPADFLKALRELCDEHGILLVFDEVQSGMGRTAKWWACDHFKLSPDILCAAKAIASGFPLSAVGAREDLMDRWEANMHGTTFGGNPVSCAAAVATIETIQSEKLLEKGARLGERMMRRLKEMQARYPAIGDVRGLGTMMALEFIDPKKPQAKLPSRDIQTSVRTQCLRDGLVLLPCGTHGNIIRLLPPLITPDEEADRGLDILEKAVKSP